MGARMDRGSPNTLRRAQVWPRRTSRSSFAHTFYTGHQDAGHRRGASFFRNGYTYGPGIAPHPRADPRCGLAVSIGVSWQPGPPTLAVSYPAPAGGSPPRHSPEVCRRRRCQSCLPHLVHSCIYCRRESRPCASRAVNRAAPRSCHEACLPCFSLLRIGF